ncbi:hypothetical protein [Burkholderia cepacia]|uniref:hypothetical protein n=1 Tax=Burkholderia cepacia TaxID=292 RepID=UPI00158EC915|nr:hypothetical protein [Burkholderia cepacia]
MDPGRQFVFHNPEAFLAMSVQVALRDTSAADKPDYARLPPPVRYRAAGTLDAWDRVRLEAQKVWQFDFQTRLASHPIDRLFDEFPRFVTTCVRSLAAGLDPQDLENARRSLTWQIYHASNGAMYEPTAALHRLLDSAYIADDVPIGLVEFPAPALCIIPNSAWQGYKDDGIRAIALFRRRLESETTSADQLTMVTWQEFSSGDFRTQLVTYPLDEPDRTVKQILEDLNNQCAPERRETALVYWQQVFDYIVKLMLYLKLPDAHVEADLAYSRAPREFKGLGQRKRRERLAEIEYLYDRHIVGPAVLDWEPIGVEGSEAGVMHHEKSPHWRRPHFKMQPHGPQSSLRKVIFVGPTIVRSDKLGL